MLLVLELIKFLISRYRFTKKNAEGFKRISVREYSGKEQLIKAGLNNVECVVDPVFLLSKEKWQQFGENQMLKKKLHFSLCF